MNKTIEELAKQYAEDMCPIGDYCGGVYDEQRNSDIPIYIDDAKSVLTWLFNKPLRDRLTDEEREKIKVIYAEASQWLKETEKFENMNDAPRVAAVALHDRLERIFGEEMFNETNE